MGFEVCLWPKRILNQRNKYNVFWLFLIKQHIPETCKKQKPGAILQHGHWVNMGERECKFRFWKKNAVIVF